MQVLVTGAAGRVGANMVRRLTGAGADVKAMIMPGDPQAAKLADLETSMSDMLTPEARSRLDRYGQRIPGVNHDQPFGGDLTPPAGPGA